MENGKVAMFLTATYTGNLKTLKELVKNHGLTCGEGENLSYVLLFTSIKLGHLHITKFLLEVDAEVVCVDTPLHLLVQGKQTELVRLLAEKNIRIDAQNSRKETALHIAAKKGYVEIVKVLLDNYASMTAQTVEGATPLHLAVEGNFKDMVQLMVEHPCATLNMLSAPASDRIKNGPINALNARKETPLHLAVKTGNAEIVGILLDNHASMTVENFMGATPLFLAIESKQEDIVQLMLKQPCARVIDFTYPTYILDRHDLFSLLPSLNYLKTKEVVADIIESDDGHSHIVDDLIHHGFVISGPCMSMSLLIAAMKKGYLTLIFESLKWSHVELSDDDKRSLLYYAAKNGHPEVIRAFLNSGFDANACVCYSLLFDIEDDCIEVARLLLASGASIQKAPETLRKAIDAGYLKVCNLLIGNGADVTTLSVLHQGKLSELVRKNGRKESGTIVFKNRMEAAARPDVKTKPIETTTSQKDVKTTVPIQMTASQKDVKTKVSVQTTASQEDIKTEVPSQTVARQKGVKTKVHFQTTEHQEDFKVKTPTQTYGGLRRSARNKKK